MDPGFMRITQFLFERTFLGGGVPLLSLLESS
jgi:hypothetical protein